MHFLLLIVSSSCLLMLSAAGVSHMRLKYSDRGKETAAIKYQDNDEFERKWNIFKSKHGKTYADKAEEERRKEIFTENLKIIDHQNELYKKGQSTFTAGVNQFTDLTHSEFMEEIFCGNFSLANVHYPSPKDFHLPGDDGSRIPKSVDWRSRGVATRVKNQSPCGSCWAFSTTGALEAQQFLKKREFVTLSEQNLVDCSKRNGGCNGGGIMDAAFQDIMDLGGIDTEDSYQYEGEEGTCRYDPKARGATVAEYHILPGNEENILKRAIAFVGPISIAIAAGGPSLQHYRGGIYKEDDFCTNKNRWQINHAVLAVGYNTNSPGNDYWIIKNSWGTTWGMEGYILWPRNKNNYCGIGEYGAFALV